MKLLELKGIRRDFGRKQVISGIDLSVEKGEKIAVKGANGSGKTTLLRIAAGSLRPTAGRRTAQKIRLAYVPQDAPLYRELTPIDHLRFIRRVNGLGTDMPAMISQIREANLSRHADLPVGTLSRGQRQRLALLLAFHAEPQLLVLDEPVTALDGEGISWLQEKIGQTDAAVLHAHHGVDLFSSARQLTVKGGKLS